MADKAISELIAANQVTPTDLFVLEQSGTAKKLTGQILENWLVSFADGHGGIHSIVKKSTSGLVDTYRITLADTTTFDFLVTNGKSVDSITKESTSGLVDTYRINFNDNTSQIYTITNGAKGDKGDNQYVWIKYASQEPTAESHSFGDVADDWIGIYSGESDTAPTDWQQYKWFQIKGEKGDTGEPATVTSNVVEYQTGDSGTVIPSGAWSSSVPVVAQGRYLWSRTTTTFNSGSSAVTYSVSRMGIDGTGSVSSVADISPDPNGNVPLTAENIGALPNTGGDLTGELKMNGQPISGLNVPTANDQAANMGFVNQQVRKAAPRNLLDNSDFEIAQAGYGGKHGAVIYAADRWMQNDATERVYSKTTHNGHGALTCTTETRIQQNLYLTEGEVYTASVLIGGIRIVKSFTANKGIEGTSNLWVNYQSAGHYQFVIASVPANTVISEPVLYKGEYTEDTLPKYQPKGYGAELAECQRYYYPIGKSDKYIILGSGYATTTTNARILITTPCEMRVKPSISSIDLTAMYVYNQGVAQRPSAANLNNFSGNSLTIDFTISGTELTANYPTFVKLNGSILALTADL